MVVPDTEVKRFLRQPEIRQNIIMVVLVGRRKHQHECRDIRRGREVETAITYTPFQQRFVEIDLAGIPLVHRHPADGLFHPLIQTELPEGVFFAGILLCGFAGCFHLVHADGLTEGRI